MRFKRYCAMLLICALLGGVAIPVGATGDGGVIPYAFGSLNHRISPRSFVYVGQQLNLNKGDKVSFDCSYLPSSASVDFGLVAPDGLYYSTNRKNGSINQSITVPERGKYTLLIRNNSSDTVTVVGEINY